MGSWSGEVAVPSGADHFALAQTTAPTGTFRLEGTVGRAQGFFHPKLVGLGRLLFVAHGAAIVSVYKQGRPKPPN